MTNGKLVGGFNLSEKYESQLGLLFPIYGQIKNVPIHQPVKYVYKFETDFFTPIGDWFKLASDWWNRYSKCRANQNFGTTGKCLGKYQGLLTWLPK